MSGIRKPLRFVHRVHRPVRALPPFVLAAVLVSACGGGTAGGVGDSGSQLFEMQSQSGDATLTDDGLIIPPEVTDDAYVGRDGGTIRYRDDADEISGLEPGMVVSLGNQGVRRIDGVDRSGGEVILDTSPATLNELISDGSIEWGGRVTFRDMPAEASLLPIVSLGGSSLHATQATSTEVKYEGTLQGYKVKFTLKAAGDRLDVTITGERAATVGKSSFSAKGWIRDFDVNGGVQYASSELEEFRSEVDQLQGEMEVKFAAIDLGSTETKFVVPAKITIPFRIYGIPANIGIGASITVKPQFHAGGSSQASFKAEYFSTSGVQFRNGGWTFTGGLARKEFTLTDETISASPMVIGMGLQVDFPLMEIGLGGGNAVMSFVNKTNVHSFYDPALNHNGPPEQSGGIDIKGLVQAKLAFLGLSLTETRELYDEELTLELDN